MFCVCNEVLLGKMVSLDSDILMLGYFYMIYIVC